MAKNLKLLCPTGIEARELRRALGLNQGEFWGRIGVTQSGGSRYESGRDMPEQVAWVLHLTYGTEKQAAQLLAKLRGADK